LTFLIGLGWFEKNGFATRQVFIRISLKNGRPFRFWVSGSEIKGFSSLSTAKAST